MMCPDNTTEIWRKPNMDIRAATTMFLDDRRRGRGRRRACSASTLSSYATQLRWFNAFLDQRAVSDTERLTVADLIAYLDDMQIPARKLSQVTISKRMLTVRVYCNWLYHARLLPANLVDDAPLPEVPKRLPKFLSDDQARKLLTAPMSVRDRAIVALLLDTGIRESECCALDLSDLNLADGTLLIRRGKGNKQRIVIFETETRQALQEWLGVRGSAGTALFISTHTNGTARSGSRLSSNGLYGAIKRIAAKVDLERAVSPHKFRHTFGKKLRDKGVPLDVIQDLMGHEDIGTTEIYAELSVESRRRALSGASPMNDLKRQY